MSFKATLWAIKVTALLENHETKLISRIDKFEGLKSEFNFMKTTVSLDYVYKFHDRLDESMRIEDNMHEDLHNSVSQVKMPTPHRSRTAPSSGTAAIGTLQQLGSRQIMCLLQRHIKTQLCSEKTSDPRWLHNPPPRTKIPRTP